MNPWKIATDEALVYAAHNGQQEALGELYVRHIHKIYNKCLSYVKDDGTAFDLAQDAFLKAVNKALQFNGKAAFTTWLHPGGKSLPRLPACPAAQRALRDSHACTERWYT